MKARGKGWMGLMVLAVSLTSAGAETVFAQQDSAFVHGVYRPDIPFPEFMPMWREGWPWEDEHGQRVRYAYEGMELGGYLYAFVRNTTNRTLNVQDVLLEDVSLVQAIAPQREVEDVVEDRHPSHLEFSKLPADKIARLEAAGEPVWWKAVPRELAPGEVSQITIRLRRDPKVDTIRVALPAEDGASLAGSVETAKRQPQFMSIGFSPELDTVYAYLRHPSGRGIAPSRIRINDQDVTARATVAADSSVAVVPVIIPLAEPLAKASFNVYQAEYADGTRAMACLGTWYMDMPYGMWGYIHKGATPEERRDYYINDMLLHNINVLMYSLPRDAVQYLNTDEGAAFAQSVGLNLMSHSLRGRHRNTLFYFLLDEPDIADFFLKDVDPYKRLGSLAQWLVTRADSWRQQDPETPNLLNINNTFKPENWYTYAQLPDIACADPYYQEAVQSVIHSDPGNMAAYTKPTYVYGVGRIYQSAAAPKPMHLILHTCRFDFPEDRTPYRAPTPEEKRIEVYYALATGAKQLSYWWYTPYGEYYGVGGDAPEMVDLWTEIGLLGAEVRTVGELLQWACPVEIPVEAPQWIWTRSLAVGDDTLILLVVNDNHFSDRLGTVIRPIENAKLDVTMPSWMEAADVFEMTYDGTQDIDSESEGRSLNVDLGTVEVTRMILVTKRPELRAELQKRYDDNFAENVRKLKAIER